EGRGVGWVAVDLLDCRARVARSRQINHRQHRRLPPAFEIRKDLLGPEPQTDEATMEGSYRSLSQEEVAHALPRTEELFRRPEFASWLLEGPDLAPFLPRLAQALCQPAHPVRGPTAQLRNRTAAAEEVLSDCLRAAAGRRARATWRSRLLLDAELYRRHADPDAERLCLAAAAALDDRSGVPSEEHPFLRQLARGSFVVALTGDG